MGPITAPSQPGPDVQRTPRKAVLDVPVILARLGGDRELLVELIELFLAEAPGWLDEVRAAVGTADCARLKLAAHTLAGAAGYFSPCAPHGAARCLEAMATCGNLDGAAEACARLEAAVECIGPDLRGLLRPA